MHKDLKVLILEVFLFRIVEISKQHGASKDYIQGQWNEARHQLNFLEKNLRRSNSNGF